MPRVTHFDLVADEPERAIGFWKRAFGWKVKKWDGEMDYWMVRTGDGDGIDGGMSMRSPQPFSPVTIEVDDIDDYIERVKEAGGTILVPKLAIEGVGWYASFKDTEGNILGMMESDDDAA